MREEIQQVLTLNSELLQQSKLLADQVKTLQKQAQDTNESIIRLIDMQRTNREQIAMLIKQNDLASKLIEKI